MKVHLLTPNQLNKLTTEQLAYLTTSQLRGLTDAQAQSMTKNTIQQLNMTRVTESDNPALIAAASDLVDQCNISASVKQSYLKEEYKKIGGCTRR